VELSAEEMEQMMLPNSGQCLSKAEATALEKKLLRTPDDLEIRLKLIGYYLLRTRTSAPNKDARRKHIEWLIDNHPDHFVAGEPWVWMYEYSPKAFAAVRQHWLDQLERAPNNARICGNFAYFVHNRELDFSLQLLKQAIAIDPLESRWPAGISHLCSLAWTYDKTEVGRRRYAEMVGEYAPVAIDLGDSLMDFRFEEWFNAIWYLGRFEDIHEFTRRLNAPKRKTLASFWRNACEVVTGLLDIRDGRIKAASERLLQAKWEPKVQNAIRCLANRLVAGGEAKTVRSFLSAQLELAGGARAKAKWRDRIARIDKGEEIPYL